MISGRFRVVVECIVELLVFWLSRMMLLVDVVMFWFGFCSVDSSML